MSRRARVMSSIAAVTNDTRSDKRGHAATSARCSFVLDGGIAVSTATADADESSSSNMMCASRPCPAHMSTIRPPRNNRRTRRATSQASYSSFRGRHPAWQTTRPRRSNSLGLGNRPTSRTVRRPFELCANAMLLVGRRQETAGQKHQDLTNYPPRFVAVVDRVEGMRTFAMIDEGNRQVILERLCDKGIDGPVQS